MHWITLPERRSISIRGIQISAASGSAVRFRELNSTPVTTITTAHPAPCYLYGTRSRESRFLVPAAPPEIHPPPPPGGVPPKYPTKFRDIRDLRPIPTAP